MRRGGCRGWRALVFLLALPAIVAACSKPLDPSILRKDGDVLRADTIIADPSTDRRRVTASASTATPELPPPENAGPDYRVGPGDRLRINVFGEPGMSELSVRVDGAGYIQVPVIELVKVQDLTTRQIQQRLKGLYGTRFVNPWVIVEIEEAKSRPLYLLGEFNNPGVQYLDQPTTLLEALALGGGLTAEAYLPGARLVRSGRAVPVDLKALLREGRLEQNVPIGAKDVIFAPRMDDMQIYVLGAVNQPKPVPFGDDGRTLLEALTLAQGPAAGRARLSDVRVIRSLSAVEGELIVIDVDAMLRGESVDFPLAPGDVVYVPQSAIADWNDVLAQVLPSLQVIGGILTPILLIESLNSSE